MFQCGFMNLTSSFHILLCLPSRVFLVPAPRRKPWTDSRVSSWADEARESSLSGWVTRRGMGSRLEPAGGWCFFRDFCWGNEGKSTWKACFSPSNHVEGGFAGGSQSHLWGVGLWLWAMGTHVQCRGLKSDSKETVFWYGFILLVLPELRHQLIPVYINI